MDGETGDGKSHGESRRQLCVRTARSETIKRSGGQELVSALGLRLASFSVQVNGELAGFFRRKGGYDRLCAAFLWSGPDLNAKKAKIAWTDVCKPKAEGGLGLRSITEADNLMNHHLLAPGCGKSLLSTERWQPLLQNRRFATEPQLLFGKLIDLTGTRGSIDFGIPLHASVKAALLTHRRRRHRVAVLNSIEDVIENQRQQGTLEGEDVFLWRKKGNKFKRVFSTNSTWLLTRTAQPIKEWYQGIWFSYATPKYSFLTWLAIRNRLSTLTKLECRSFPCVHPL
ncbi:unnamed protein product [Microthlaspi erraticum]|uniref:Reverse transcriptase zinc-binding domain-containing protein n=1 Tax=Microthlaspi erraticum TaxID=1685480 RepID=A0A6D2L267_9BRAS|nr:unnamed protein product [Microthlaspi erraticum]